jgi:dTDP-4-amino-4,6-dideoxygalactose transaminase
MGLVQLGKATRMRDARERIALRYAEELADLPLDLPLLPAPGQRHAWHIYVIGVRDEAAVDRDELARSLTREGIGISVHYTPLHMHPLWAESMNLRPEDFPNARRHAKRALTIPLSSRMTDDQVDRVVRAVRGALS